MISPPRITRTEERNTAVIHLVVPGRDLPKFMDPAIQEVLKVLADQGLSPSGPMFAYHHRRPSETFDFELGFPIPRPVEPGGRVVNGMLPSENVVCSVYQGPYEGLGAAWAALQDWVRQQKIPETGRFWECYLNDPDEVGDPGGYRTELNWVIGA